MVSGARTSMPLLGGFLFGALIAMFTMSSQPTSDLVANSLAAISSCQALAFGQQPEEKVYKDVSEHWIVHQDEMPQAPPNQDATPKVVRTRFAATELGTRERLMVAVMAESALALSINTTLGRHVPKVHLFADSARIDNDMAQLTNLSPYKLDGQKVHSMVLGLMFNMTVHENYDWILIVKDSTYINPFTLLRMIDTMNWNEAVVLGEPTTDGRCRLDTGVLLSNPALQTLIQQRHFCNTLATGYDDDQLAFEKCLHLATNLTCRPEHQGVEYKVWRGGNGAADSPAAHDRIEEWMKQDDFNSALAVPRLLSDADALALHDHYVRVEIDKSEKMIKKVEKELEELSEAEALESGKPINWPQAVPSYSKPPNRYQVPTWEFFTMKEIFLSEPDQNVRTLEGKDLEDVEEVVAAAKQQIDEPELEFVALRNGYRVFDPRRGMDYIVDLTYRKAHPSQGGAPMDSEMRNRRQADANEFVERRVHLTRMIASTQLMNQVPYVKEDTDVTIVVPVSKESEVMPARKLLARQARLCLSPSEESRKTRVVIAVFPEVDPRSVTYISNDIEELKRRCKRSLLETDILSVKPTVPTVGAGTVTQAALDEAVDRYGANVIYLLVSPHADIQKEFFDRARINTIKHYQVFFPIPFVEYHPTISGMDMTEKESAGVATSVAREIALTKLRDGAEPKRKVPLLVQKDHGRFDSLDFSCFGIYGIDYLEARQKAGGQPQRRNDIVTMFLGQEKVHVLRAIEPTLRIRYHHRECDVLSVDPEDIQRCETSRRENVAAKDQLAKLLFNEK